MSEELRSEALVLHRIDYGEADRIVWLLLPARGRLSAFASGARRSRRRFGGALEPFSRLQVRLTPPRRGDLWRLQEAEILDAHEPLRTSLEALACASVAGEICLGLAGGSEGQGTEASQGLFVPLTAYLRILSRAPALSQDLYRFVVLALEAAGVALRLSRCARCGRPTGAAAGYFDSAEGGRLCPNCPPRHSSALRLSAGAFGWLLALGNEAAAEEMSQGRQLLWQHVQYQLGKPLRSLSLLRELGLD